MTVRAGAPRGVEGVRVLVLGPVAVEHDGRPLHVAGPHRRRLLAFLASRAGRVAGPDAIADVLWGENLPPTSTKSIQNHVARLRRSFASLDGELIETSAGGYRLAVDPDAVDAVSFERLAAEGGRRLASGDASGAASVLADALALWRGPAYGDLVDAEFAVGEAARLDELRWTAIEDLGQARLELGDVDVVVADLQRLVREQPGRERAWGLLIHALYGSGRQRDALDTYQRAREVLAEAFGLEPGPALRELERRVLAQDPALVVRRPRALPAPLRRDTNPFLGRAPELEDLIAAWRAARNGTGQLRLVFGPVDSGRTRLVAELADLVVSAGDDVVYLRGTDDVAASGPGAFVDHMAERSHDRPLVVVVDDAEWATAATIAAITAAVGVIEHLPMLLVVVANPAAAGAALESLRSLDVGGGRTVVLDPLDDETLTAVVVADGFGDSLDADGTAAVVAIARGLPGVARREAVAWAERTVSDRLTADAVTSIGANVVAAQARASVFDDVLDLVAARARRDELVSSVWAGRQPYRSLAAYQAQDADLFVGRERLVAELAARLLERRLVAVVGASGSGKSSLVRAGLVPLVRSGRLPGSGPWRTAVVVPGTDPIATLDGVDGLDEPGPLLLVVDQFEEAFLTGTAEGVARRLDELSCDTAVDVHVVIVVRSDHYPALAAIRSLATLVEDALVLVGPPTDDELRRIVEVPARRTGCVVDPALTSLVVEDVAGHHAALPLVSAALAELWHRRSGDTLTVDGYLELGGLASAVPRMGAKAVERVGEDAVRAMIIRLVDVTEDGNWVRRRVDLDALPAELGPALDALVDARLVHRGDGEVDVVHEVVFGAWPLLARWLDDVRAELVLDRDLRGAARAWDTSGRSDDYVYRGARLAAAEELAGRSDLEPLVSEFIRASADAVTRAADERTRHHARENRRLRGLLIGVVTLLAVALVAGALALRQADRADQSATEARAQAVRADARRAGDRARATAEIDRALLLAVAGVRLHDSPETRANLLAVLAQHRGVIAPERRRVAGLLAASADGGQAAAYADGRLTVHGLSTLGTTARSALVPPVSQWSDVEFSPDGAALAVLHGSHRPEDPRGVPTFAAHPVVLYDARTLEPAAQQLGGVPATAAGQDMAYSADSRFLAVALAVFDGAAASAPYASQVFVWDLTAPAEPVARIDPGADFTGVAVSADGGRVYAAIWPPGGVRSYDTATGAPIAALDGVGGRIGASSDGTTLAVTGLNDGEITVIDAATLTVRARLTGRRLTAFGFPVLSHSGTRVAAPDWDERVVYVWDVPTGEIVEELVGQTAFVKALWFGADDTNVYAYGDDESLVTWDLRGSDRFVSDVEPPQALAPAEQAVPLDDRLVAYLSGTYGSPEPAGSAQWRDLATGRLTDVIDVDHAGVTTGSWRRDGRRFATTGLDGVVRVWDPSSGALLVQRQVADGLVGGARFTADGERLIVVDDTGAVFALDAETLHRVGPRVDSGRALVWAFPGPSDDVAITVTSAPAEKVLQLVDLRRGRVLDEVEAGFFPWWAVVSPDGTRVAVTGAGGELRILDVGTMRWLGSAVVGHRAYASSVAWSADGQAVVTGGVDGTLALWDGTTGDLVGNVEPGASDVALSVVFIGDTSRVLVAAADGETHYWDTDPRAWADFACAVAGRNLTEDEWRAVFVDRRYQRTCPP